jgi:hypothetical protein
MSNITITKTITQPEAVINQFANDLGYQEQVANPDYIPAEFNAETMEETKAAVGEPTLPNKQSRTDFVSEKFDEFVAEQFFGQFAKRNAERLKAEEAKELTKQTVAAIKATIVTK